jgi:hypothetical protein
MHRRIFLPWFLLAAALAGCAGTPPEQTAVYACDSGQTLTVTYRGPDIAIVQMGPRQIEMTSTTSAIGQRYVGQQLQWVTQQRDDERIGTLFTRGYDGGSGEIAERCLETDRD